MGLARVIGTVVATRKYTGLAGVKLLVVQSQEADGTPRGEPHVACDTVMAGPSVTAAWSSTATNAVKAEASPKSKAVCLICSARAALPSAVRWSYRSAILLRAQTDGRPS